MWRRHFLVCWSPSTSASGGTCSMWEVTENSTLCNFMVCLSLFTQRRNTVWGSTTSSLVNTHTHTLFHIYVLDIYLETAITFLSLFKLLAYLNNILDSDFSMYCCSSPGVFGTVEMRPPTVGTWLVECTIGDHQLAGMRAQLLVYDPRRSEPKMYCSKSIDLDVPLTFC